MKPSACRDWLRRQSHRARQMRAWSLPDWGLAFESLFALIVANRHVARTPFKQIATRLDGMVDLSHAGTDGAALDCGRRIGGMVARVAAGAPFEALCLAQAIAVHGMLRRRGVPAMVHFGVRGGAGSFTAHAWVSVAGEVVVGGNTIGMHVEIAQFGAHRVISGEGPANIAHLKP